MTEETNKNLQGEKKSLPASQKSLAEQEAENAEAAARKAEAYVRVAQARNAELEVNYNRNTLAEMGIRADTVESAVKSANIDSEINAGIKEAQLRQDGQELARMKREFLVFEDAAAFNAVQDAAVQSRGKRNEEVARNIREGTPTNMQAALDQWKGNNIPDGLTYAGSVSDRHLATPSPTASSVQSKSQKSPING